jgi:sn-glycerol 3-phosphate transport system permease protein
MSTVLEHGDTQRHVRPIETVPEARLDVPVSHRRKRIRRGPAGIIAIVLSLFLTAIPVLWMLLASVKSRQDLTQRPLRIFPSKIIWENYRTALTELPFFRFFLNSLFTTVLTTAIKVALGVTTAYALVFLKFRFQRLVFWFVVASLMVPFEVVLIPNYVTTAQLGWLNTWMGVVVPTAGVAFGAYLLYQNFRSIPTEIVEAAQIDGVSKLGLMTRIVIPMSKPSLAAFALITAVSKWNDYLWPRLITSESDSATLPLGLTLLRDSEGVNEWGPIMAGAVLVILPAIPLVLFAQRRIVEGLTGGVKG